MARGRRAMGRGRSGAVVETFEHDKTKRVAQIRLEKSSGYFHTVIETAGVPETFESTELSKVRSWLREQLKTTSDDFILEWKPVIELHTTKGDRGYGRSRDEQHEGGLRLSASRYWLALTPNQHEWRKIDWGQGDEDSPNVVPAAERYALSERYANGPKLPDHLAIDRWGSRREKPFRLPYHEADRDEPKYVIEYKAELWEGLMHIIRTLGDMRKTIGEMVSTKTGLAVLAEIGAGSAQLMLTSGPTTAKPKRGGK